MSRIRPEDNLRRILNNNLQTNADQAVVTRTFYASRVVDIDDPLESKRVRVRIDGIDDSLIDKELPWCITMMPPFFHFIPKVGEMVFTFVQNPWNRLIGRHYFGPIMDADYTDERSYEDTLKGYDKKKNIRGAI